MSIIAFDLGGTKLSYAVFSNEGTLMLEHKEFLPPEKGAAVGALIENTAKRLIEEHRFTDPVKGIGIGIPGIYRSQQKTVWAPNIPGWDNYPLWHQIKSINPEMAVHIDSDRACCILGEAWMGAAKGCEDAIFMTVGTGIGAGILSGGHLIRGASDIAGAIGWMALEPPFKEEYKSCGNYEGTASGDGIAKTAQRYVRLHPTLPTRLNRSNPDSITARDVFAAFEEDDVLAVEVIKKLIEYWGMATANLVSLFNPKKIIFGGGIFGPATKLIPLIYQEALLWAQPISIRRAEFVPSELKGKAGIYGAAAMVWNQLNTHSSPEIN